MNLFTLIYSYLSWFFAELKSLWKLFLSPIKGKTHQERLENFYKEQAEYYDQLRKKLLHGREDMFNHIKESKGVWVDLGGGTGTSLDIMAQQKKLHLFKKVYIVDLSPSLLEVAKKKISKNGWKNVETVVGDATTFRPSEKVDLVTYSYCLTMIPDWFLAIDNGKEMLCENGQIAAIDFYVSRRYPGKDEQGKALRSHGWITRIFWPLFFCGDNVNLDPDHLPYLMSKFKSTVIEEKFGSMPYVGFIKAPYYIFVGSKVDSVQKKNK